MEICPLHRPAVKARGLIVGRADLVVAFDRLKQDLSIAARGLRRRPGLSAMVIATLALGIGAATTIFTVVERLLLKSVDPNQAPESLATMSDLVGTTIAEPRFQAKLIGAFSFMAVVLAAVGIYGVLAASVFERRHEIGIRMALGAVRSTVVAMMLKRVLVLALVGVAGGAAAAYGLTGILARFLFGITPTDVLTFVWASAVLLAVALLAGLLPARRTSRLDPITTLRGD